MSLDPHYDVVVVGAGHNGLIAASYLARSGLSVVVLEASETIGGATRTEEIAPGFRASSASYAFSLFRPDIYYELDLARHGLRFTPKDPQMFVPLPGGEAFYIWRDARRTVEELVRVHPKDAEGYKAFSKFWDHAASVLRPYVEAVDPPTIGELETQLNHAGEREVFELAVAGSAAEVVDAFFYSDCVKGAFAGQGIIGTMAGPRHPGTAWVMAYHFIGGELSGMDGTWSFVHGGMGSVSGALASSAIEAGASIQTGAPVKGLTRDGQRIVGVVLEDGREVGCNAVASSADPFQTYAWLDASEISEPEAALLESFKAQGCVVKANLALSELPDFAGGAGPDARKGTMEVSRSIDHLESAFEDAAGGRFSEDPFMEVFVQSANDPSLVDGDGDVLSAFTQWAPAGSEGLGAKPSIMRALESHLPGISEVVVGEQFLGPAELQDSFRLPNGDIFHGAMLPEQSFGSRFGYRTSVRGLYLCGSGAWPGGGVMGAPGRNCASVIVSEQTS